MGLLGKDTGALVPEFLLEKVSCITKRFSLPSFISQLDKDQVNPLLCSESHK